MQEILVGSWKRGRHFHQISHHERYKHAQTHDLGTYKLYAGNYIPGRHIL
jgi:hypothetical protein